MKKRLLVIANIGFIIGIILGLYFNIGIILFLLIGTGHFCNFLNKLNLFNKELQKYPVPTNEKLQKYPIPTNKKISKYLKVYITKKVLITFIVFCILGIATIFLRSNKFEDFWKDMTIIQNNNITVNAIVVSDKESKEYNDIYKVKIVRINNKKYCNTYCIVKLNKSTTQNLSYGSLIQFKGEFQEPQDRTNFKGYSYKEYLKTVNVYGTFKTKYNNIRVLKENSYGIIHMLSNKVKNSFKRSTRQAIRQKSRRKIINKRNFTRGKNRINRRTNRQL